MDNWKKDRIDSALDGTNPTLLAKMKSGFAVFGDTQFLPGYCVLLGYPRAGCLNDLSLKARADFLTDMTIVGDAITQVYNPLRMNYDILGNTDTFLHAHIFPRYEWEDSERRAKPVWLYPASKWSEPEYQFDRAEYQEKKIILKNKLIKLIDKYYAG